MFYLFKIYLLYKCPEEHRFQAAGNERKKEREKERKKEERKKERKKERKIPANCRVDQLVLDNIALSKFKWCFWYATI